jgi:hypothetical protein
MNCSEIAVANGCMTNAAGIKTGVNIHYEYALNAAGETIVYKTRYTDAAGVPIVLGAGESVAPGPCATIPPDVEWEKLCDKAATGVVTEFFRRSITSFNSAGVASVVASDWQLDKTTAYVPAGTVGACQQDCDAKTAAGVVTTWG